LFAIRTTGLQDSPELRQRMAAQILRQMIDEKLQIQDAKRLGLKATDGELQQRFSDIERSAGMPHGQFRQYLQSVGVPLEIAVQQIEAQIAWNKIIRRKVRPQVDVSEAEIDDALNRMRSNVGKTESRVAEIFVPVDRVDLADEAKRSADRIIEQLKRGAPFGAVAQQFSQGATAQAGGELGWVLPGSLDPSLDTAVEKLPVKQHSEPIRSTAGWHILYVIDRRQFAATRPDDMRLNLTQMTLPLPTNASPDEVARATSSGEALVGRGKVICVRLRRMSSGRVAANCRRSMTYRICQPAVLRMGSECCLTGSFSTAVSRDGSSDPGRTQPSSPPAWAVAPWENCWATAPNGAPRLSCSMMRSALRLASSARSTRSTGTKISATRDSVLPTLDRIRFSASSISASETST